MDMEGFDRYMKFVRDAKLNQWDLVNEWMISANKFPMNINLPMDIIVVVIHDLHNASWNIAKQRLHASNLGGGCGCAKGTVGKGGRRVNINNLRASSDEMR